MCTLPGRVETLSTNKLVDMASIATERSLRTGDQGGTCTLTRGGNLLAYIPGNENVCALLDGAWMPCGAWAEQWSCCPTVACSAHPGFSSRHAESTASRRIATSKGIFLTGL